MNLVRMKRTGKLKIIDVIAKNEPEGAINYNRIIKIYNYQKLKAFNYETVRKSSIENCLEDTLEIMGPTLPYTIVENYHISIYPTDKVFISMGSDDDL